MAERSFVEEVKKLRLGAGETFRGEGILAVTKALLESGVAYVAGYQGSPISHLMDVLADARDILDEHGIRFENSASEATAAATLAASVNYPLRGAVTFKSTVGTNVASDALANLASGGVTGGALIVVGEDYGEGSSIMQERSHAFAMKSQIWLLDPRPDLPSIVRAVKTGFELSEASHTPVMLQLRIRSCHVHGEFVAADNVRPAFTVRDALAHPRRDVNRIVLPPASFLHEQEKIHQRWPDAVRFIQARGLNEFLADGAANVGLIVQGGLYNTLMRALLHLGVADVYGNSRVPVYVMNVTYPVVDAEVLRFCAHKRAVLMIEEGQPNFIEQNVAMILRQAGLSAALHGKDLLPLAGEYTVSELVRAARGFLVRYGCLPDGARATAGDHAVAPSCGEGADDAARVGGMGDADRASHAGCANHADSADRIGDADRADGADHLSSANRTGHANYADSADRANGSGHAGSANHTGRMDRAGSANYTSSARHAVHVDRTDNASHADHAGSANYADHMDRTDNASRAGNTDHAGSANRPSHVDHANDANQTGNADHTGRAVCVGNANYASHVDHANDVNQAGNADHTGRAVCAGNANHTSSATPANSTATANPIRPKVIPLKPLKPIGESVHARPPGFCTGCPERPIFAALKLVERELGPHHVSADIGCHLFSILPPFHLGNTTMGYGLGAAGAAALNGAAEPFAVPSGGEFAVRSAAQFAPRSGSQSGSQSTAKSSAPSAKSGGQSGDESTPDFTAQSGNEFTPNSTTQFGDKSIAKSTAQPGDESTANFSGQSGDKFTINSAAQSTPNSAVQAAAKTTAKPPSQTTAKFPSQSGATATPNAPAKRAISVMGDGGFWHNGLTSGIANAVFNRGDGLTIVVDNSYTSATGGQDILSSAAANPARSTGHAIEDAVRGVGVQWVRTLPRTYDVAALRAALTDALTTTAPGPKVLIAQTECMLNRQRREKPLARQAEAAGQRVARERFGVDADTCTGDHACIRLSGCPSLSIAPNPDPLRADPVTTVLDSCVGCGLCGAASHAAVLCPSFYRARVVANPTRWERLRQRARRAVTGWLQRRAERQRAPYVF